jgi:phosphoglycolate phosphatase
MKPIDAYAHVVWDWNGTLFDDVWLCVDVMNGLLAARRMALLTVDRYRELFDFPVKDYYRRLGFDFETEPFEEVGSEFIRSYESRRHEAGLKDGAVRVLESIGKAGAQQSVLSAYQQGTLEELIDSFSLTRYFVRVVGLQDHYAHSKVENGVRWIQGLSHAPHDVLLVGDSVHDAEVAEAMGVDCILLRGGHQSQERLEACGKPVLGSLEDLVDSA